MILLGPCGKEELPDSSDDISFGIFLRHTARFRCECVHVVIVPIHKKSIFSCYYFKSRKRVARIFIQTSFCCPNLMNEIKVKKKGS